jgi:hypothetical protein
MAYMDVAALAPRRREDERVLTQDEKNIRWALNKFFYTTKKQSLMTAYTMMLKEKYCDSLGYWLRNTRPSISFGTSIVRHGTSRTSTSLVMG